MTVASTIVAVGFGLLMGWALGWYERRPALVAVLVGIVGGGLMLTFTHGPDAVLGGMSLLLGCGAALLVLLVRRRD